MIRSMDTLWKDAYLSRVLLLFDPALFKTFDSKQHQRKQGTQAKAGSETLQKWNHKGKKQTRLAPAVGPPTSMAFAIIASMVFEILKDVAGYGGEVSMWDSFHATLLPSHGLRPGWRWIWPPQGNDMDCWRS
jgi:hypothetical protein